MTNTRTFVGGMAVVKNAARNLLGQGLPLIVAFYCIPQLIDALGAERFGFLTLIWVVVGYLSIFDLGLGQALTKLVAEKIGRGEQDNIPPLFWTAMWLMCGLGVAGMLITEMVIPYLVDNVFNLPSEFRDEARSALSVAALSLPFVIVSAGTRGLLEAYQRFDLINWIRIPLGIFTFAAPLLVTRYISNELSTIALLLALGRFVFLCSTIWLCIKINPALRQLQNIHKELLIPLLSFGGWMTLTNLIGPMMVYLDRFVIGALVSMSAVAYYVTPYEVVTKLWILPGALIGALFPAFAINFTHLPGRTVKLFSHAMDGIFISMLSITILVIAFAREGLSIWLGHDFAMHSVHVLQILAVGVLINSFGRVPYVFIQAAGRPDIPARLFMLELPLYLFSLLYMLDKWGIEGAAFAWVMRIVLDNLVLLIASAHVSPGLKPAMWRGIAMSILPCALLFGEVLIVQLNVKVFMASTALAMLAGATYWFRGNRHVKLTFPGAVTK